jgi:phosphomannomutase
MPGHPLAHIVKAYDVRGVVPDQLDGPTVAALGAAFAEVVARPDGAQAIVIGHDMRPSSPQLAAAFADGAASRGLDVHLLGLTSTDGLYYASGALGLPGVMLTASHNPAQYNGLKMCRSQARPISLDTGLAQVRDVALRLLDGEQLPAAPTGAVQERDITADYATYVRGLVDLRSIRPLRVVVDAGNGMAGLTVPAVLTDAGGLEALPLTVVPMYFELDGTFPNHEANPLEPENLRDLQREVLAQGADLGLAFDGDADRCFVVDERGVPVNPSAITAMVARREIAREVRAGADPASVRIVFNVISSAAVPEVVAESGGVGVRTRVGHSFIKAVMAQEGAVFGGEHSAHYYFRDFWFADTGMLAAMHVMAALGSQPAPLSQLVAEYDRYVASGEINSRVDDVPAAQGRILAWAHGHGLAVDELDGLTCTAADPSGDPRALWWANVRASNTEPLLRLNVEARDRATMERVRDEALALIRGGSA